MLTGPGVNPLSQIGREFSQRNGMVVIGIGIGVVEPTHEEMAEDRLTEGLGPENAFTRRTGGQYGNLRIIKLIGVVGVSKFSGDRSAAPSSVPPSSSGVIRSGMRSRITSFRRAGHRLRAAMTSLSGSSVPVRNGSES